MKKLFIVLILFPFLIFAQNGPKIEIIGGESINAGSHKRGHEVKLDITFKNTGDQDLLIKGVSTSCGCTSALTNNEAVKPGESGSIKFTFNGQGLGSVTKIIMITTNEPGNPTHNVQMTMNMTDPVTLNPGSIITEGKIGDEIKHTATIQNSIDKEIDITEITSNTPVIKISSDKMILQSGEAASLDISIKIYEESTINAAIIIKTTEGEYQIPVLVDVKSN